jgi:hypothetical protein
MKIVLLLVVITIIAGSTPSFTERPAEKDIIRAFLSSPEIIEAQDEFKDSADPRETRILMYESLCGAVGCQSSALVAQEYQRDKANPFTSNILGRVHIGEKGNILRVERVILVPFKDLQDTKNVIKKH